MSPFTPEEFAHFIPDTGYNPQEAHAYYLRTRKLKGRQAGVQVTPTPRTRGRRAVTPTVRRVARSPNLNMIGKKRQAAVNGRVASLQARLASLNEVLKDLLDKAKTKDTKDKSPAKKEAQSGSEPQTAAQKKKQAESSKDFYEKNKKPDESKESTMTIEEVRAKIVKIRAELKTAIGNARQQSSNTKTVKGR